MQKSGCFPAGQERQYAKEAQLEYNPPMFLRLSGTISLALSLVGTLVLYGIAINNRVSVANIRPTLEMARPILEAEPEIHADKKISQNLKVPSNFRMFRSAMMILCLT